MDNKIEEYYSKQAESYATSWASTMVERDIREKEIESLIKIITVLKSKKSNLESLRILEIGCGNGYVAGRLKCEFDGLLIDAFDSNAEFIEIALKRNLDKTSFKVGSFEELGELGISHKEYDFIFSVRCLINIENNQKRLSSLAELTDYLKPGGYLSLLEGFSSGQENYNLLREALSYERIPPAWHNFYLDINEVKQKLHPNMKYFSNEDCNTIFELEIHHLSNNYLAMRVLLPTLKGDPDYYRGNRNDNLGQSITRILPKTENFSPLQIHIWEKS